MNNVFKVVFNRSIGRFVVASELAKGVVKSASQATMAVALTAGAVSANAKIVDNGIGNTIISNGQRTVSVNGNNNYFSDSNSWMLDRDTRIIGDNNVFESASGLHGVGNNNTVNNATDIILFGSKNNFNPTAGTNGAYSNQQSIIIGYGNESTTAIYKSSILGSYNKLQGVTGTNSPSINVIGSSNSIGKEAEHIEKISVIGDGNKVNGSSVVAIGQDIEVGTSGYTKNSIAIGQSAKVNNSDSIAIGSFANARFENSLAIGVGTIVNTEFGVALGSSSVSNRSAGVVAYTANGINKNAEKIINATIAKRGALDIGSRQITSVAAGTENDDAVNVAQLKATDAFINELDSVAVKYDDASKDIISLGSISKGGIADLTLVKNVKDGEVSLTSKDAVNGSQLFALTQSLGGGAVFNNGIYTAPTYTIQSKNYNDVGSAFNAVDTKLSSLQNEINNIQLIAGDSAYDIAIKNGFIGSESDWLASLNGKDGVDGLNGKDGVDGLNGKDGVDGKDGASGIGTDGKDGLNGANGDSAYDIAIKNGFKGSESDWLLSLNGKDGLNYEPVDTNTVTGDNSVAIGDMNTVTGDNSVAVGKDNAVTGNNSTVVGNNATVGANNSVSIGNDSTNTRDNTVSVGSKDGERQITNVSAGTHDTDAVNLKQMKDADLRVLQDSKQYTDSKINSLESSFKHNLSKMENKLSAGIAGAMAIGNLAQPTQAGLNTFGVGIASYNGEQAVSFGLSAVSDNNKFIFKSAASADSQSNLGGAISFNFQF